MNRSELSRVAVIGGGPAGSFFALHLFRFARALGISPQIDIYEPRDFALSGPRGCNRCAGILSSSLLKNLRELNLEVPPEVIQSRISVYSVHSPFGTMEVENPSPGGDIYSVYRGSGPLRFPLPLAVSFDAFLLGEAKRQGATVIPKRVRALRQGASPAVEVGGHWEEYDLVVLATGVNAPDLLVEGLDYQPPPTYRMAQDELHARQEDVEKAFGNRVRVFLLPHSDLVFGTLVPKGSLVNVSLLGQDGSPSVEKFLSHPLVKKALPFPYTRVCGCRPMIAVGMAQNPVGERFVAVGDAGVTRLYKDGIGSAFLTARQAAYAAAHFGTTSEAFQRHYVPFLRALNRDNAYGRLLFSVHRRLKDSPAFYRAQAQMVAEERGCSDPGPSHRALWGMFTGSYSYGQILRTVLEPAFPLRLFLRAVRQRLRGIALPSCRILILGGGFGGVYAALHLERALRKQKAVELTLVSRDNFFLFTPLLHEVATGGIETRHIAYPIRTLRGRRRFTFMHGEVESIDLEDKSVLTNRGPLSYDYLVLALGSTTDTRQLPELTPNVFTLKDLYDAMVLRNHVIALSEEADACPEEQEKLLTFVVAGGGATGVQLVAEMRDFIFRFLLKNYRKLQPEKVRLILIQNEERLLEEMDPGLGSYALSVLKKKGVEVRLRSRVTKVLPQAVEINEEEVIPTHTVVWATGIRGNPVVECLPLAKDAWGRVKVNQYLEVSGASGVYALGDNALFINPKTGRPLPARAHVAVRQPRTVARNILADLLGGRKQASPVPWVAETVSLGSREAAMKLWRWRLFGLPARFLWLISYLFLVPSVYARTRVVLDWLLALFFGRDTTLLRLR
ncbi:MAG: FAD-dependent oxidoreductase [Chloroflexi bacterium]|nr:FAD-dependent oxidoreductase [Chloroflexota bacterium]